MQRLPQRTNWPALGMAVAMALVITTGVPAMMQHAGTVGAPHVEALAKDYSGATEVTIEPVRIEVTAVRERSTVSRWLSLASFKRAG